MARFRRQRALPVNRDYLPPNLRSQPQHSDFAAASSLAGTLPVTLYWGMERNVDLHGCRPPGIPRLLGRFDWVIGFEYGWADTDRFPQSILCEPAHLASLLVYMRSRWPKPPSSSSFLAVAVGPDYLLSWQRRRVIRGLQAYFSAIYYEAKDIDVTGVDVMPMGFTEHYTRANADRVLAMALNLRREPQPSSDSLSVLAAWGAWWPGLDGLIPDRAQAREFANSSPLVTVQQLSSDDYFTALTHFDFMLCPLGNGVQAPKIVEALLMGCIPITTWHPTFVELQQRGLPVVIVESWDDITEDFLREAYREAFPRAWAFRDTLMDLDAWWRFSFPCLVDGHAVPTR